MSVRILAASAALFAMSFAVSFECVVLLGTTGLMIVLWFGGRHQDSR